MAIRRTIFDNLLIGTPFTSGGTHYIKKSARTARMNDERYSTSRIFYFGKSEPVETESIKNPRDIHIDIGAHNMYDEEPKKNPRAKKSYIVLKIAARNDTSGNPQRGWLIWFNDGSFVDFVDEGYSGRGALTSYLGKYPYVDLGSIEVEPKIYKAAKKQGR